MSNDAADILQRIHNFIWFLSSNLYEFRIFSPSWVSAKKWINQVKVDIWVNEYNKRCGEESDIYKGKI